MQDVTEVHRDVARLRVDGDCGQARDLIHREGLRRVAMRAGQEPQLTIVGVRLVELDTDVEAGAQHEVPADAAIAMPRQIGEAADDRGVLDDDRHAVEPIGARQQVDTGQRHEFAQPRIVGQLRESLLAQTEIDEPATDLMAVGIGRPPRSIVARSRGCFLVGDQRVELVDLARRETHPHDE